MINDPALSASQPAAALAAGSANALAHATVGLLSDRATPIGRAVARDGITQLKAGWSQPEPDRHALALGALLAGWAVDHSGLGPHHALAQTAVRIAQLDHAHANAALLPATISALRARRPAGFAELDTQLGVTLESVGTRLRNRAGADGLGAITTDDELLDPAYRPARALAGERGDDRFQREAASGRPQVALGLGFRYFSGLAGLGAGSGSSAGRWWAVW